MKAAPGVFLLITIGLQSADLRSVAAQEAPVDTLTTALSVTARALFSAPGGDSIGYLSADASLEVIDQDADWVRVRIEGWMHREVADAGAPAEERNLSLSALRSDPERYLGQTVRWQVQYVALQRADALRTDMEPGQRYLLVRDPGGEPGFVYVVVPEELLEQTARLAPLQRVGVVGRILAGRSPLTGHPILELVEILH